MGSSLAQYDRVDRFIISVLSLARGGQVEFATRHAPTKCYSGNIVLGCGQIASLILLLLPIVTGLGVFHGKRIIDICQLLTNKMQK